MFCNFFNLNISVSFSLMKWLNYLPDSSHAIWEQWYKNKDIFCKQILKYCSSWILRLRDPNLFSCPKLFTAHNFFWQFFYSKFSWGQNFFWAYDFVGSKILLDQTFFRTQNFIQMNLKNPHHIQKETFPCHSNKIELYTSLYSMYNLLFFIIFILSSKFSIHTNIILFISYCILIWLSVTGNGYQQVMSTFFCFVKLNKILVSNFLVNMQLIEMFLIVF